MVKAFRLAQLTIEYLVHVQVMLDLACVCVSGPPTLHQRDTPTPTPNMQDSLAEQLDRVAAQYMCEVRRAAQLKNSLSKVGTVLFPIAPRRYAHS